LTTSARGKLWLGTDVGIKLLGLDGGIVELGDDVFVGYGVDGILSGNMLKAKEPPITKSTTPIKPRKPVSHGLVFFCSVPCCPCP
jgi:hypothetical protein